MNTRIAGVTLLLILLYSSMLIAGDSPIGRGSLIIGGSFSYEGFFEDKSENYNLIVEPEFQYFVIPGFALGADIYYYYWKREYEATTQFGIGPSMAYYMYIEDLKGYPFVRAAAVYTHSKAEYHDYYYSGGHDDNAFKFRGSVGYSYFLSRNICIAGSLDYTYERVTLLDIDAFSEWRDVFGFSIGLKAFIY